MADPKPFAVDWRAADVGHVLERVRAYPFPPAPAVDDGWGYGCDAGFLKGLCAHWLDGYDWRGAVEALKLFATLLRETSAECLRPAGNA